MYLYKSHKIHWTDLITSEQWKLALHLCRIIYQSHGFMGNTKIPDRKNQLGTVSYSPHTCWWFNPFNHVVDMMYRHFFIHIYIQWWESGFPTFIGWTIYPCTHTNEHWFFQFVSFGTARCTTGIGPCLPMHLVDLIVDTCQSGEVSDKVWGWCGWSLCKPVTSWEPKVP